MNLIDYVKKNSKITFEEKPFNEVDNLVFAQLSYLDFTDTSINYNFHTLEYLGREYLKLFPFEHTKRLGPAQGDAYKLLEAVIKTERYKDVIAHDYVYIVNKDMQFCAMMFKISDDLEYISYEGTDEYLSGWKENLELSYKFPVPAQKEAIRYANKHIKLNGPNVIIGGHSKGGNLALVAGMYTHAIKKFRILKVYSNDGPGLRFKEFYSGRYRRLKSKYVHIIPHSSIVGVLLRNSNNVVVKSTKNNVWGHASATWVIKDDELVRTELSKRSKTLETNILDWLLSHSDEEKKRVVQNTFKALEEADLVTLSELHNVSGIVKAIEGIHNIDKESKKMLLSLFTVNLKDIEETFDKIKNIAKRK